MSSHNASNAFLPIYERYVDEASFLWVLLGVAQSQPHYNPDDIKALETRISRQLDGIMTAPNVAWPLCVDALALADPGEAFTASAIAFRCGDFDKIQTAVEASVKNAEMLRGLISALAWVTGAQCHSWVVKFFSSKDFCHKRIALEACDLRDENPAMYLTHILRREDCCQDLALYACALRSIGKFKRADLLEDAKIAASHADETIRFWAIYALILLGERSYVALLKPYVMADGPLRDEAIQLAFRALSVTEARTWIGELAAQQPGSREIITATAALGDPHAINWLIAQMNNMALARLAGEAFTTLTGIHLVDNSLADENLNAEDLPDDDSFTAMDADENLPFPVPNKVADKWRLIAANFISGQRYFMGKPINDNTLLAQLHQGYARHRQAAALELALRDKQLMLKNTRAKLA